MNEWYEDADEQHEKREGLLLFISTVAAWSLLICFAFWYDAKFDSCDNKNKHEMVSMAGRVLSIYGDEFSLTFYIVVSIKDDDGNKKKVNVYCTHDEYLSLWSNGFRDKYITFYYDEDAPYKYQYHTGAFSE